MTKILICFLLILSLGIYSKRLAPKKITSVIHNGKEYTVDTFNPGIIQIKDLANKTTKTIVIYTIQYNLDLEKDVQDVFIKTIQKEDNSLLIQNERGERFLLNFETNKITKVIN